MFKKIMKNPVKNLSRDFLLFLLAVAFTGFAQSLFDSTFNNFFNDRFAITSFQRAFMEIPREMPGMLVIVLSALFFFICNRRLAAVSQLIAAAGILFIGLYSFNYSYTLVWLFIYSAGQHIFLPLTSDIGMELAHEGNTGKRLGQFQGASNFAAIGGSFAVMLGFRYFNLTFKQTYVVSAVCFFAEALLLYMMKKNEPVPISTRFKFRKEYRLYYILAVLYGTRKQIFLTFAPWVLVTVFMQKTQAIALLLTIGGVIGIFFKPMLGRAIDRYGEKVILMSEAAALIAVCAGYGFSRRLFALNTALIVSSSCFIIDQLLMSVNMARATYLKKIAATPQEVTSTLTAAVSIDHAFSISIAVAGGLIWKVFGYEYIFFAGALIAVLNLFTASKIWTPLKQTVVEVPVISGGND